MSKNMHNAIFTLSVGVSMATVNMQTVLVTMTYCLYYGNVKWMNEETFEFSENLRPK